MTVSNEDLVNILRTMHADIKTRFEMLDKLVRTHEVKLAVIDRMMETFDSVTEELRQVTLRLGTLEVVTDRHSKNWDRVWKYVVGVVLTAAIVSLLGLVFIK